MTGDRDRWAELTGGQAGEEYARRFPEYAAVLRDQIGLHRAVMKAPTAAAGPDSDPSLGDAPTDTEPAGRPTAGPETGA